MGVVDSHGIFRRFEGGEVVHHDQVALLGCDLGAGPRLVGARLEGEGDAPGRPPPALRSAFDTGRQRGDHVGGGPKLQRQAGCGAGNLAGHGPVGLEVAWGCRCDHAIGPWEFFDRCRQHLSRGDHWNHPGSSGVPHRDRPADDRHLVAARQGRLGDRPGHPATRGVGEIPHLIDVGPRGAGGEQDSCHRSPSARGPDQEERFPGTLARSSRITPAISSGSAIRPAPC